MSRFNCNVWGIVDFGFGPVDVRCTRIGEHEEHICSVVIEEETNHKKDEDKSGGDR